MFDDNTFYEQDRVQLFMVSATFSKLRGVHFQKIRFTFPWLGCPFQRFMRLFFMITGSLFDGRILRSRLTYYVRHHLLITNDFLSVLWAVFNFLGSSLFTFYFRLVGRDNKNPKIKIKMHFLTIGFLFSVRTFHFF